MKEKVLAIVGPTAVGKTKLGVELAKRLNGEVISGDSMQIYRSMDIGTAKATEEERQGIVHHMLDIKDFHESFSVAEFQSRVQKHIQEIQSRGRLPIIVGGTGLYIQSVLYDYRFSEATGDDELRRELEVYATEHGNDALHRKLQEVDPQAAENIHPNNVRRVVRALEVYRTTGMTMTDYQKQQSAQPRYQHAIIGLTSDREQLYERINTRVDEMVSEGLVDEVKRLYEQGLSGTQASQAIGYKEIIEAIEGKCTMEEAVEQLKQNSRRYAKRQFTWFKNKMAIEWFDLTEGDFDKKVEEILEYIAGKLGEKSNV
ncbi:tRNA (adenosine(37)-N6)-dimethylallyltransferase MiaA [Bacillus tianshenii]|nr:tRNA (adenosine(37)-N6)-dimethylallyltransferase MiaA [Bacillus tianshenii]